MISEELTLDKVLQRIREQMAEAHKALAQVSEPYKFYRLQGRIEALQYVLDLPEDMVFELEESAQGAQHPKRK